MSNTKIIQYYDRAVAELRELVGNLIKAGYTTERAFGLIGDPAIFLLMAIITDMQADGERLTDADIEALYAEIDRRALRDPAYTENL